MNIDDTILILQDEISNLEDIAETSNNYAIKDRIEKLVKELKLLVEFNRNLPKD